MSDNPFRKTSLQRRLLGWLLLPLVGLLLVTAIFGYPVALYPATAAYDWALIDAAHSLARLLASSNGRVELKLPAAADTLLRTDQFDRIYYAVHDAQGGLVAGDAQLVPPPMASLAAGELLYDTRVNQEPVRVAALLIQQPAGAIRVQVAETTVKRHRLGQQILTGVIFIEAVLLITLAVLVYFAVGKGLEPLQRLRAEIEARSSKDLRAVPEENAPAEMQSVVRALNNLLRQLGGALENQRQFIANAAHQLRTPLAGLRAQVEYALRQSDPHEWLRTLQRLEPATERTVRLAQQLLTLARAEVGTSDPDAQRPIDLRAVIEDKASDWMPLAIARDIDLGLELEPAPLQGDALLVGELLANLVDNAIRYSSNGGRVTVRCARRDGTAVLEVEDDGPGIPAGERERVFRRFHRVAGAPGEGCGLGLAIVEEIARVHRGSVEIGSGADGRGTRVTVRFHDAEHRDA